MRLSRGGYLIREGFRSIATHGFMSFATVAVITACLILMGSMGLLALNIDRLINDLENENEIVAFVDDSYTADQAQALAPTLRSIPNITSVEFVSRASAMDTFMSKYDDYLMEGIDEAVFRDRYVIHLEDISEMAATQTALRTTPGIVKVNAHLDYANTFVNVRNIVSIVALVLIVLLVFVSFFIMSNTIKLATVSRRDEIAIMKMVGATNGFIRLPFEIEGLVLGVLGGGIAYLCMFLLYRVVTVSVVEALTGELLNLVPFGSFAMEMLVIFLGIGVLVGVFGALNAIKNYLKV